MSASIALALSGGGIRAMAFHLGVLRKMAELQMLERVRRISTVSGGSLLMGLVYRSADYTWPTSKHFLHYSYYAIAEQLCTRSMQLGAFVQLLKPFNLRYCLSRANLLALELRKNWGMDVPLSLIPADPEWSINGTTAENGKRFRFKGKTLGDWDLGYAEVPSFTLGNALAVSAAFPVGFGPLAVPVSQMPWRKRPWNAAAGIDQPIELPFKKLHLYDGGLYDNLGTEPFFDIGTQQPKYPGDYIIVSDAGAPFARAKNPGPLNPFRIKRMMDIMSEQCRSLRVRSFFNYINAHHARGALFTIGTRVSGQNCSEAAFARSFPTSLKRLDRSNFERLANYGYAVVCERGGRQILAASVTQAPNNSLKDENLLRASATVSSSNIKGILAPEETGSA